MKPNGKNRLSPVGIMMICGTLLLPIYVSPLDTLADALGARFLTVFATAIGVVYGIALLQVMWRFEKQDGRGTLLFAWCYFVVQHVAFGFGGLLESIFDQSYAYTNSQGTFPYNEAILPLFKVHLVSMTAGLLGVWLATRNREQSRRPAGLSLRPETHWSWEEFKPACLSLLVLHALLVVLAPELKLKGVAGYLVLAISTPANATPVLWGLVWQRCTKKWIFLAYYACFGLLEVIRGGRTAFVLAAFLFVFGLIFSGAASRLRFQTYVKLAALSLLLAWAFVVSDNVRNLYSRSTPGSLAEAEDRVESLRNSEQDSLPFGEGQNGPFRIASRIFEVSAADVIARTPDQVPFWGWTREDWTVLLTSAFPLGLNKDAAFYTSERNGVFYLRSYGWYVDPFGDERAVATSMPATLVGDSWRRLGWPGVVVSFCGLSWLLARLTWLARFGPNQLGRAIFAVVLLSEMMLWYSRDFVYLIASLPRSFLVMAAFSWAVAVLLSLMRRQRTQLRSHVTRPRSPEVRREPWPAASAREGEF